MSSNKNTTDTNLLHFDFERLGCGTQDLEVVRVLSRIHTAAADPCTLLRVPLLVKALPAGAANAVHPTPLLVTHPSAEDAHDRVRAPLYNCRAMDVYVHPTPYTCILGVNNLFLHIFHPGCSGFAEQSISRGIPPVDAYVRLEVFVGPMLQRFSKCEAGAHWEPAAPDRRCADVHRRPTYVQGGQWRRSRCGARRTRALAQGHTKAQTRQSDHVHHGVVEWIGQPTQQAVGKIVDTSPNALKDYTVHSLQYAISALTLLESITRMSRRACFWCSGSADKLPAGQEVLKIWIA
ncbi:hypothetical protein DFH07DRAFT_770048 [Mycena maculata]|uniref:Uncharacterized protein n=1 Tax=Mycena maculata TaxID=230809 RepID=A0AAD7JJ39_9AGAR|nr:hypothetical protein DFH07DRAFT_770048 [Mycena maculata]